MNDTDAILRLTACYGAAQAPKAYNIGTEALIGLPPGEVARRVISTGRAYQKSPAEINRRLCQLGLSQYTIPTTGEPLYPSAMPTTLPPFPAIGSAADERCVTPAERVQHAAAALKAAEEAQAKTDAEAARINRINEDLALARATVQLLTDIRDGTHPNLPTYAKHRAALQPLARSYGFKIVLVHDRSVGTLVTI